MVTIPLVPLPQLFPVTSKSYREQLCLTSLMAPKAMTCSPLSGQSNLGNDVLYGLGGNDLLAGGAGGEFD